MPPLSRVAPLQELLLQKHVVPCEVDSHLSAITKSIQVRKTVFPKNNAQRLNNTPVHTIIQPVRALVERSHMVTVQPVRALKNGH